MTLQRRKKTPIPTGATGSVFSTRPQPSSFKAGEPQAKDILKIHTEWLLTFENVCVLHALIHISQSFLQWFI